MPRISLKQQPNYDFQYRSIIKVRDINYGGHLGNDAVVGLLHEARIQMLKDLGCTEMDLGNGKSGIILTDLVVNYKAEGFMMDKIRIESHIDEMTGMGFRIFHKIVREPDDVVLVLAETGILVFDYKSRSITTVPKSFEDSLGNYLVKPAE